MMSERRYVSKVSTGSLVVQGASLRLTESRVHPWVYRSRLRQPSPRDGLVETSSICVSNVYGLRDQDGGPS